MSRPSDIPEDVWQAANMAVVHAPEYTARLHEDVARAILAERKRCAKVAEAQALEPDMDDVDPYDMYEMGGRITARQIAAAIRKGEPA